VIKGPKDILIVLLALTCLGVSLVMQPWAELGFTGNFPAWLAWAMDPLGVAKWFTQLGDTKLAKDIYNFLIAHQAPGHFGDYAYALFLFAAMIVAAVAIVLIGREDAEEKTILPVKK